MDSALKSPPVCRVLLVDKPAGVTSHDVVARLRRHSGVKKVGHGGTLDPFATGLLLILVGKATRMFDLLAPLTKVYRVTAQFGAVSSTGDAEGEITPRGERVTLEALTAVLPRFTGKIQQRAHVYSAVKVGGEPLYKKARRGEVVEAPVREIEIERITIDAFEADRQQAVFTVTCSKGTYIRQLCEDIGSALGSGAYAAELRRLAIGEFQVEDAKPLAELESWSRPALLSTSAASLSCLGALYFLPVREVDDMEQRAIAVGRPLPGEEQQPVRLTWGGRLLAVYGPGSQPGTIKPLVVLT